VSVLFVGPGGDAVSDVLRDIGRKVRLDVRARGRIVELWDSAANREDVDTQLDCGPNVLYFGHGFSDALSQPVLVDRSNIASASNRIVLALCCSSADQLGEEAVNRYGVSAYLGFTRPIFVPLSDAGWSLTPWYVAGVLLVSGATAGAVALSMKKALCDEGDRIYQHGRPDYASAVNDMLVHYGMSHCFVCLGDVDAVI